MKKRIAIYTIAVLFLSACAPRTQVEPTPMSDTNQNSYATETTTPDAASPASASSTPSQSPTSEVPATKATVVTSRGTFVIQLDAEAAPGTVSNFTKKAVSNYYKGLKFHRVEDWVVQGGDPLGNGTGGDKMPTELSKVSFVEGSVGVARGGDIKVSNDSQFFVCTTDCDWLTGQYTNFGKVISGMDVVKKIAIGDTITSITVSK